MVEKNALIDRERKKSTSISKLISNNQCSTDKKSTCDQLNENTLSINVGPNLAHQLPPTLPDPTKFIKRSFTNSFMFRGICTQEVYDLINVLDVNKATTGIPVKCIKLAKENISEALASVFNLSLLQGIVPDTLKISKVTPNHYLYSAKYLQAAY